MHFKSPGKFTLSIFELLNISSSIVFPDASVVHENILRFFMVLFGPLVNLYRQIISLTFNLPDNVNVLILRQFAISEPRRVPSVPSLYIFIFSFSLNKRGSCCKVICSVVPISAIEISRMACLPKDKFSSTLRTILFVCPSFS